MSFLFLTAAFSATPSVTSDGCLPSRFITDESQQLSAIYVEVTLEGATTSSWAQLDTGIGSPLHLRNGALTGVLPPGKTRVKNGYAHRKMGGKMGHHPIPRSRVPIAMKLGNRGGRVGSVGASTFADHVLVLDLADAQVCISKAVPKDLWFGCQTPLHLDPKGRPLVEIEGVGKALFDTGSAPQGLWVKAAEFERLTGLPHTSEQVQTLQGQAFGKPITIHHHPATDDVVVGDQRLERLRVTHVPRRTVWSGEHQAVLGLHGFRGARIALDFKGQRMHTNRCTPTP